MERTERAGIVEVLKLIDGNGTSFAEAAARLGMTIEEMGNRIETLISMGCLEEEGKTPPTGHVTSAADHETAKKTGCIFCPLADMCRMKKEDECRLKVGRVYRITEKGKKLIEETGD